MAPRQEQELADAGESQSAEVATITDKKLLEQFAEMAAAIPSDVGGGQEDILRKLFAATTWDELNEPWEATKVDDILGKPMRLVSVVRRPSSFQSGLGIMLVVKLTDAKTGKEHVKATGSVSIVGQLAWLYFMGATAVLIEWCRAERPSTQGFYPQHLKILDAAIPGPGSAS
jgi:hypothetical protein